jgi:hypothetical protein
MPDLSDPDLSSNTMGSSANIRIAENCKSCGLGVSKQLSSLLIAGRQEVQKMWRLLLISASAHFMLQQIDVYEYEEEVKAVTCGKTSV